MEALGFLVLLVIFVLVVVVPIASLVIARGARDRAEAAEQRLEALRALVNDRQSEVLKRLTRLETRVSSAGTGTANEKEDAAPSFVVAASVAAAPSPSPAPDVETVTAPPDDVPSTLPPTSLGGIPLLPLEEVREMEEKNEELRPAPVRPPVTFIASPSLPPPLPFAAATAAAKLPLHPVSPADAPAPAPPPSMPPPLAPPPLAAAAKMPATPPVAATPPPISASPSPTSSSGASTLEQFMGVKLFAWVGGLALFLGIVFFIKLSMEKGWISETTRIAIGYSIGLGLVAGGWVINARKLYTVLGQTLCATGVVVLYGVTFAAHSYYAFPAFTPMVTFAIMSAITIGAFSLAVRMDAQVVAILGMLGGFLTPIICSSGQDRPFALFGYIALLDIGVLAVAMRKRWHYLAPLAAGGTALMQSGWVLRFFSEGDYAHGGKLWIAVAVFLGFAALFTAVSWWQTRDRRIGDAPANLFTPVAALMLCASAMLAAFAFAAHPLNPDRPAMLFGYALAVNALVMVLAWRDERLEVTTLLAAGGTVCLQLLWSARFFTPMGYAEGAKTWAAIAIYLSFAVIFTGLLWWHSRRWKASATEAPGYIPSAAALIFCMSALVAAFGFLPFDSITARPITLYTFTLLVNVLVMAVAWLDPRARVVPIITALATFLHLTIYTTAKLEPAQLPVTLVVYLVFGALYTGFVVLWSKKQTVPLGIQIDWVPVPVLPLMMIPVMSFPSVSLWLWPALLVANLLVLALAIRRRRLPTVAVSLVITMATIAALLIRMPSTDLTQMPLFLTVLGGFALVFAAAGCVLANLILRSEDASTTDRDMAKMLPVGAAAMPFLLLVMAVTHLRVPEPSLVFGMALLLCAFMLGLGVYMRITVLPLASAIGVLLLELAWHSNTFSTEYAVVPMLWYLGFGAVFMVYPHLFRRQLEEHVYPWAAAALAWAGTFPLVYHVVKSTWPNEVMGLLPLAFAVPAGAALHTVLKQHHPGNPARLSQLAWFGGLTLLFITLIFPIQFDRQWITLGWAFEGAALCWLFRRVPHPGLRGTGTALLLLAFTRLALNPWVLNYQVRDGMPILNWQLYTYSLAAASLFLAAWWLNPPRHLMAGINLRGLFAILGTILLFLLVNIEIADAFTAPGAPYIVLEFSGNFARDMTYSIAWALFALALLVTGFAMRNAPTRYAGIVLLALTLLKLFFHDLSRIESIYRIGALIAVALIALAASFLYQRFLNKEEEPMRPDGEK